MRRIAFLALVVTAWLSSAIPDPAIPSIQQSWMDPAVKPCEDFFQYANGAWLRTTPIPPGMPLWGTPFEIEARNQQVMKGVLERICRRSHWPRGSSERLVGDFFASGMDTSGMNRLGIQPLVSRLQRIDRMRSTKDLAIELARLHKEGVAAGFTFTLDVDDKHSARLIAQISQGGLSLLDREDYIREDKAATGLRTQFEAHVARMFELAGSRSAEALVQATAVMAMETRLARASMTRMELRKPEAVYHVLTRGQLQQKASGYPWEDYFQALGLPKGERELLVRQPVFFAEFAAMTASFPTASWRAYLRWHLLQARADHLGEALAKESFAFRGTLLRGSLEQRPRWDRVLALTEESLGEPLGRLYVAQAFPAEAKRKVLSLVESLRGTLRERIHGMEWMSAHTRASALRKLEALTVKIGYPDRWMDVSRLGVKRQPFVLNLMAAARWKHQRSLRGLGKPVNRQEWGVAPSGMFAYYSAQLNEICFPAGILQPPILDPRADDATNYGGIGFLIGHELTHGFDDEGRHYDGEGNLRDWWSPGDASAFEARTRPLVKQFADYRPLPDLPINGEVTLGENIADLGGLTLAFEAFKRTLQGKSRTPGLDGFTPEQRFFIAFAQAWFRTQARPEYLRLQVNADNHAPPKFRVNGALANLPGFHQAFSCGDGTPMSQPAESRAFIW